MGNSSWDLLAPALEGLNRGDLEPALNLCSPDVVLNVGRTASTPWSSAYSGRESIAELWQDTFETLNGAIDLKPAKLLSGDRYLLLFVDVSLGTGSQRVEKKLIVTGSAGPGGLWKQLWLQFDDQPRREPDLTVPAQPSAGPVGDAV